MSDGKLWPWLAGIGAALVGLVVLTAGAAGAGISSLLGLGSLLVGGSGTPSTAAVQQIPLAMLALYQQAATTCPGLPWTVLAAIGTVESANGTSDLPGVHSGANYAGAEVIYGSDLGLRHVRDEGVWARASDVSAGCEARDDPDGEVGGLTLSLGSVADDGQVSGVACSVS